MASEIYVSLAFFALIRAGALRNLSRVSRFLGRRKDARFALLAFRVRKYE
jgi:hypothetical protein